MIRIEHLYKAYGSNAVVQDLTLRVEKGEKTALLAPSGCGKTTLLRLIAGLEKLDAGRIETAGKIAYVFQEARLFPGFSVLENVAALLRGRDAKERAAFWLEKVGLGGDFYKTPEELSGGMAQRAVLAGALASERQILLLDEPFKALDEQSRARLYDLLDEEAADKTLLLVTHDVFEARRLCGRILRFEKGMILKDN